MFGSSIETLHVPVRFEGVGEAEGDSAFVDPVAGSGLARVATNLSINHIQRYKKRWTFFSDIVHRDDEGGEKEVEFSAPDTFFSGVDSSERREWVERAPYFEAVAVTGDGVFDTLKAVSKLVLKSLS